MPFPRALEFLRTLRPHDHGVSAARDVHALGARATLGIDSRRELDSLEMVGARRSRRCQPPCAESSSATGTSTVREIYGSNETLFLGASCPERGVLHLDTRLFIAELLDADTLAPVEAGKPGVFTLTHIGPKAMPLVRYVTRDVIRVISCDCGRPEPAVELLGRQDDIAQWGNRRVYTSEILEAGYRLAEAHGSRIFFAVLRESGVCFRIEVGGAALDARAVDTAGITARGTRDGRARAPRRLARPHGARAHAPSLQADADRRLAKARTQAGERHGSSARVAEDGRLDGAQTFSAGWLAPAPRDDASYAAEPGSWLES